MTYSIDYRRKVLSVREKEELTIEQVAKRFCVGIASVTRWLSNIEPKVGSNKPSTMISVCARVKATFAQ